MNTFWKDTYDFSVFFKSQARFKCFMLERKKYKPMEENIITHYACIKQYMVVECFDIPLAFLFE